MPQLPGLRTILAVLLSASLSLLAAGHAIAQWYPQQGQQPQYPAQPSYPPQAPQYPGGYPASPQPAPGPGAPAVAQPPTAGGAMFTDAFGRFKVNFPQGTVPTAAMYNFMNPSAMTQIAIQIVGQEQMFQTNLQNFPAMMRQMGATVGAEQSVDVRGKRARLLTATMRDQSSGMGMQSLNVFIPEVNLWIQVMGPEQNATQVQQTLQAILAGLQF